MSNRLVRHARIRKRVFGAPDRLRLSVFRSSKHLTAQLIDDTKGVTLCGMSTISLKGFRGTKTEKAAKLGELMAEKMLSLDNFNGRIVFDRGGYKYHGRIKAFADSLRQKGIIF